MQRINWFAILAGLGLATSAAAQDTLPPPAPTVVVAPQRNLWSCIWLTPDQQIACRTLWCQSFFGQLSSSAMGPISGLSGGLIQNCCVANAIQLGLRMPADSAQGAAAVIMLDQANVEARRKAVRYLGTVDCNWWPEAESALCDALLKDRSECVRWEAALALQKGCCCTQKVLEALTTCISGNGKPPENSERVKAAAIGALSHCCAVTVPFSGPMPEVEKIGEMKKAQLDTPEHQQPGKPTPGDEVIQRARRILAQVGSSGGTAAGAAVFTPAPHPGSVAQILSSAFGPSAPGTSFETPIHGKQAPASVQTTASVTPPVANQGTPEMRGSGGASKVPFDLFTDPSPFVKNFMMILNGQRIDRPGVATANAQFTAIPSPAPATQPAVAVTVVQDQPPSQTVAPVSPIRAILCPPTDPPADRTPGATNLPDATPTRSTS